MTKSSRPSPPENRNRSDWRGGIPTALKRFRGTKVPLLFVAAAVLAMSLRLFSYIEAYAVNILYWDQWDFLTGFFSGESLSSSFLRQQGPHRLGIGGLVTRLIYWFTSWNVRAETFVSGACFVIATLVALRIKQRLFGAFTWSDAAIPLLFLTLVQCEIFVTVPIMAHGPLPLLLVMLYCLTLLHEKPLPKVTGLLLLNFAAIYTGFGLFLGVVSILLFVHFLIQSSGNRNLLALYSTGFFVAVLSLVSFFVNYTFVPAAECFTFPHDRPLEYITFVAILSGRLFGAITTGGTDLLVGYAALLLMLFTAARAGLLMLRRSEVAVRTQVIFALVSFTLLFDVFTAVGRVCFGVGAGAVGRYVPYNIPAVFALYLTLLDAHFVTDRVRNLLLATFLATCTVKEVLFAVHGPLNSEGADYSSRKKAWSECYRRFEDVERCTKRTRFKIYPNAEATRLHEKLQFLKRHRLNLYSKP